MAKDDNLPRCCAECGRYIPDKNNPGRGFCDEWPVVHLHDTDVCHPNIGRRRKEAINGRESQDRGANAVAPRT